MANRLLKLASVTYIPGVPAIPAIPARSYVVYDAIGHDPTEQYAAAYRMGEAELGKQLKYATSSEAAIVSRIIGNLLSSILGTGPTAGGGILGYIERTVTVPGKKGVPGIPAKVTRSPQTGWNGGGRSIARIPNNGYVTFKIGPLNIGALVGLSGPVDSQNFSEATHAIYQLNGEYHVVESGVIVATLDPVSASGATFRIDRANSVVTYSASNGFSYVSAKRSAGPVYLDALLYTADDYVDSPALFTYSTGAAAGTISLQAFISSRPRARSSIGFGGRVVGRSGSKAFGLATTTVELGGSARGKTTSAGAAQSSIAMGGLVLPKESDSVVRGPALRVVSSETSYARSSAEFSGVGMASAGGAPVIETASSVAFSAPAIVRSRAITGGTGDTSMLGRLGVYSIDGALTDDANWGRSKAVGINHFMLSATDPYALNDFTTREALVLGFAIDAGRDVNLGHREALHFFDEVQAWMLLDASVAELLMLNTAHGAVFDIDLFTEDTLFVSDNSGTAGAGGLQVAVNLDTAASTVYQGFDFLRIINTPTGSYGVRNDGVYEIGRGYGDNGTGFDGMIDFGVTRYNEMGTSRVRAVFLDGSIDGDVRLRLTADDGIEREYSVIGRDQVMRAAPALGVAARSWRVRVSLSDASQGVLSAVRLDGGHQIRRWIGG